MSGASPCPTPMTLGKHKTSIKEEPLKNPSMYKSLVGGLQYLINTIPDISFTVNQLSQHNTPTTIDWQKEKRVLRFLKAIVDHGLHIKPAMYLTLTGFSDVDLENDVMDRKSNGGYCEFLDESLMSWSSKKQGVVLDQVLNQSIELWHHWLVKLLG